MNSQLRVLRFDGIHPDTLGSYLSSLGLLTAMAQSWPESRGCWRDRRFLLLHESLSSEAIQEYLLARWQPTRYERWWEKPYDSDRASQKKQLPNQALPKFMNGLESDKLAVLDASVVSHGRLVANPIFGDGAGKFLTARRDFSRVQASCWALVQAIRGNPVDPAAVPGKFKGYLKQVQKWGPEERQLEATTWLRHTLFATNTSSLPPLTSAGTWFLHAVEMFNSGQNWSREETTLSPWSFLLALEGALLLRGSISRMRSPKARPYAVFPFVCDPAQPTTAGEVAMSKGEFWAPLWDCPATLAEVRHLLKRGLARIGKRSAQAPSEFAIAALAAGTDAGVSGFARFDLRQTTSAKVYEAVPRGHVPVLRPDQSDSRRAAELLSSLVPWLNRLPYEPRDAKQRGRFRGLRGPVEAAIIRVSEGPADAERWRELLLLVARQQARIDRNKALREDLPPLPLLDAGWFSRAWPEHAPCPDEVVLARSFASVGAGTPYPLLLNLFGVELGRARPDFMPGDRPQRAVWNDSETTRLLGQVLQRRLIDAECGSTLPLGGTCPAPLGLVARLLAGGGLDLELLGDWVLALGLIDWRDGHSEPQADGIWHDGDLLLFGLFRPIFHECPRRVVDWLPEDARSGLARRVLNLIQFGQWEEAIQVATAYYRAAGRRVVGLPQGRPADDDFPARLAAALLAPLNDQDISRGLRRWIVPEKVSPR